MGKGSDDVETWIKLTSAGTICAVRYPHENTCLIFCWRAMLQLDLDPSEARPDDSSSRE